MCDGVFGDDAPTEASGDEPSAVDGLSRRGAFEPLAGRLAEIQSRLMDVGSAVATPLDRSSDAKKARVSFAEAHVDVLEALRGSRRRHQQRSWSRLAAVSEAAWSD